MESELRRVLLGAGLDGAAAERVTAYWRLLVEANERQNLTRLTEPGAFFSGHVLDVLRLRQLREQAPEGPLSPAEEWMDLGSGAGVPGLLSAVIHRDERWLLVESERRKAEFLAEAAQRLGVAGRVRVIHGRAESVGARFGGLTIASKAVGSVEKLHRWMRDRSTWNTLVLFKGPKWAEEWSAFGASPWRGELEVVGHHDYATPEGARRVIIQLGRVPRGTPKNQKMG